jgi:hypothetical protein
MPSAIPAANFLCGPGASRSRVLIPPLATGSFDDDGRPLRRPSFVGRQFASRGALRGVSPHVVLGEDRGPGLATHFAPVQKASAQKRKFLDLNAESPCQSQIGSHRTTCPYPVVSHAFEFEYAASQIVSKSAEYKLHLCAPSKTCLATIDAV